MLLSKINIKNLDAGKASVPEESLFALPEKVLQFGTGVLLRGLPDYFIDKANRQGIFNGRIIVVKSTEGGDGVAFDKQDGMYTLCMRGITNGQTIEENIICSAISRVLSASKDWATILECAHNPELTIIISNTTEVGIELISDDIHSNPPISYPGKLLAFLYERYKAFEGSPQSGMVIVPTELISDNGEKLEAIVLEQAHLNSLDTKFIEWLKLNNHFCNSLVDRIVPGKPAPAIKAAIEAALGYQDDLLTMSEVYSLWAIEGDDHIKNVLSFSAADEGVVITDDIMLFKELKLRLLNGTHSLSCGVAFLAGFSTVKEAMADKTMYNFISRLMLDEIAVAIPYAVPAETASTFAGKVLDRFSNPSIEHLWISISLNFTSKIKMRIVQVIKKYAELFDTVPENIATGIAAYLLFTKPVKLEGGVYYGEMDGVSYPIKDDKAALFFNAWQQQETIDVVQTILSDASLWDMDLCTIPGFAENVAKKVEAISSKGVMAVIEQQSKLLSV